MSAPATSGSERATREAANAIVGMVAGLVLIALTIWTAAGGDMSAARWAGAFVALLLGVACLAIGVVRWRRLRRGA